MSKNKEITLGTEMIDKLALEAGYVYDEKLQMYVKLKEDEKNEVKSSQK